MLFNLVVRTILLLTLAVQGIVNDINYYNLRAVRAGVVGKLLLKTTKLLFFMKMGVVVASFMSKLFF